ncbi:Hydrogen peroxide-inducible genes activator [Planctomycetes bacterium K23_9]|uniref:Hydrogen peroxide-inducible genes activator n=2 Tax=Stieleria marina TaxID=1930275 RepID=A0A517NYV7_9BACT|nr:Hydrogen peroxide-inducible genes activator [Planctomycetes bacterium K23_9]
MQHLEESIGVQLIDRSKRPLVLTAAGRTYVDGVRKLVHNYHRLEQEVRCTSESLSGTLTLGTIYSVGLSYMPEAFEAFTRIHPDMQVHPEFGTNERVIEMTADGTVDFGLVSFPKNTKQLRYVLWQQEPMRLVCSPSHPLSQRTDVTLDDLNGMKMIGFDRKLAIRKEIDQSLAKAGVSVDIQMEFDNCDSMVRAIQANRGIGIVPEAAVHRETATGALRVVACRELRITRPLGILYRRAGRLSRAASEFGSLLLGRPIESEKEKPPKRGVGGRSPTKPPLGGTAIDTGDGTSVVA